MANIVGDIAISVGADVSPLVRDLGRGKSSVDKFGNSARASASGGMRAFNVSAAAMAATVVAVGSALAVLTKRSMENIDATSKMSRNVGLAVREFQAMAMVAAEAGVEQDKLSRMLVKMSDNIVELSQGTNGQVEAFEALGLSMADLNGLTTDERFRKIAESLGGITDPAKRIALAMDVFGKSAADAVSMFDGYGRAVDNAAAFQERFGIAVSDTDAAKIEAANDAMGRLGMLAEGVGNSLAVFFAPKMLAAAEATLALAGAMADLLTVKEQGKGFIENVSDELIPFVDIAGEANAALLNMAERMRSVGDSGGAAEMESYANALEEAVIKLDDGVISQGEFTAELENIVAAANLAAARLGDINSVEFGGVLDRLSGLLAAVRSVASAVIELPGITVTAPEYAAKGDGQKATPRDKSTLGKGVILPIDTGGGRGGGGGGLDERLARMREEFMTESEVLQAQFEERLAQIEEFRNAKLLTEAEFNELEAQAKEQHEKRLADIERAARGERLSAYAGAFGDLASLMQSGNDELFSIGQAAAIAEATISGYQAAVDAWQKGMKIGGPPTAAAFAGASLLKTGNLIAGIAGASPRGGGGRSAGAAGGGGGAAAPQQPTQTLNFTLTNDPFGIGENLIRQIATQMNEASRNGFNVRANLRA